MARRAIAATADPPPVPSYGVRKVSPSIAQAIFTLRMTQTS